MGLLPGMKTYHTDLALGLKNPPERWKMDALTARVRGEPAVVKAGQRLYEMTKTSV